MGWKIVRTEVRQRGRADYFPLASKTELFRRYEGEGEEAHGVVEMSASPSWLAGEKAHCHFHVDANADELLQAFAEAADAYPEGKVEVEVNVHRDTLDGPCNRTTLVTSAWQAAEKYLSSSLRVVKNRPRIFPVSNVRALPGGQRDG